MLLSLAPYAQACHLLVLNKRGFLELVDTTVPSVSPKSLPASKCPSLS